MQNPKVIERLFARLLARYASKWVNHYSGIDADAVKADWAMVLDGLSHGALMYGLDNLPDYIPTATQFRDICRRYVPAVKALPEPLPEPDLERLEREFRRLGELAAQAKKDPRGWAKRLKARADAGEHLSIPQRHAMERALRLDYGPSGGSGSFTPPPPEALPPGGLRPEP